MNVCMYLCRLLQSQRPKMKFVELDSEAAYDYFVFVQSIPERAASYRNVVNVIAFRSGLGRGPRRGTERYGPSTSSNGRNRGRSKNLRTRKGSLLSEELCLASHLLRKRSNAGPTHHSSKGNCIKLYNGARAQSHVKKALQNCEST